VCSLGSAVSVEGDRQCQRSSAIAPVHTLLMSPQYLGTGITSQPFIKQTYDLCIWLPPPTIPTGYARSTAQLCHEPKSVPPEPGSVLRNIPWYLLEVLHVDGIIQVAQTYCPITKTPGNCIRLSQAYFTVPFPGPQIIHLPSLSCISNSYALVSSCQASLPRLC
jgi:hypothetical protein